MYMVHRLWRWKVPVRGIGIEWYQERYGAINFASLGEDINHSDAIDDDPFFPSFNGTGVGVEYDRHLVDRANIYCKCSEEGDEHYSRLQIIHENQYKHHYEKHCRKYAGPP